MKKYVIFLISTILLSMLSCKDNTTNPPGSNNYSVSGKLISDGEPLPNATVSLNKRAELTTQSNNNGEFLIDNIPTGDYSLIVEKTNSDGSFLTKSSDISVANNIVIGNLLLPKAVTLLDPIDVTATSMKLIWSATDANDFREYKLYRHISSGLDETTGTLVHVATSITDTQFIDNEINPLTLYYYRVYIMNEYGKLGGNNIVTSTSLNKNILQNGSFEQISANFPVNWNTWGTQGKFNSNSDIVQEGIKSIKVELALSDWGVNSWGLYQQINPNDFELGKSYKISFWCKTDSLEQYESISCRFTKNNYWDGNEVVASLYAFVEGPRSSSEWEYFSFILTVPTTIPSNYYLTFDLIRAGTMGYTFNLPMVSWIDNITMEKIQ